MRAVACVCVVSWIYLPGGLVGGRFVAVAGGFRYQQDRKAQQET